MMGSETFIIVALRCSENSTPCAFASAICSATKAASALRLIADASTISPAFTFTLSFSTVTVPSAATSSIFSAPSAASVADCSLPKKSPAAMWATCDFESALQAPMRCGCLRAKFLTDSGARRSELPSRSTGFTALPLTLS